MPLDPVALAALEALSESESESSSSIAVDDANTNDEDEDDDTCYLDMGNNNYDCSNTSVDNNDDGDASSLTMDDYSPIIKNKKGEGVIAPSNHVHSSSVSSKKRRKSDDNNKSNAIMDNIQRNSKFNHQTQARYPLSHLKPFFDVGTAVYGPWWTNNSVRKDVCDQWFPGTISSYKEIPSSSPYGPLRLYTIQYDDGDVLEDVQDHFVFSKEDYLLHDRPLRGVRCEADAGFADDKWASVVGWYVVTIDGVDEQFATLADAMDAYDNHFIQQKGGNIQPSNLNRPEKYPSLLESSSTKAKKRTPRSASSTKKSRYSPPPGKTPSAASTMQKLNPLSNNNLPSGFSSSSSSESELSLSSSAITSRPSPRIRLDETSLEPSSTASAATETTPSSRKSRKETCPGSEPSVTPKTAPRKEQKISTPPASKYKGVTYSNYDKKYVAQIEYKNKFHSLGLYKFEADAALAYDMGCKLLWEHRHDDDDTDGASSPAAAHAVPSSHSDRSCNFAWRESYDENIQEEMKDANRKRINVDKSYSKVSAMVEVYLSKIFVAEEKKMNASLEKDPSGDDCKEIEYYTMNSVDKDANTGIEFAISAHNMDTSGIEENDADGWLDSETTGVPSSRCNTITKEKGLRSSLDADQSGDDNEDGTSYDDFGTSAELDFPVSSPNHMDTSFFDNGIEQSCSSGQCREEGNCVPSPQRDRLPKKYDHYCVEWDKVRRSFLAYITLPRTEEKAEKKYWLGEYKLESDAALACDKAATLLQVETLANFSTMEEYEDAKQNELDKAKNRSDNDMMSSMEIATHVFENIMHHMNNVLTKKWEKYLHATNNRRDFLESYQTSIHNILTLVDDKICGIEEVCDDKQKANESDDTDDNASLFSTSSHITPQGCL